VSAPKLRVLIAAEYARPWPGGISEHVFHEAQYLKAAGHSVCVLSGPGTTAQAHGPGIEVIPLAHAATFESNGAASRLSFGRALFGLRARLATYDVVHVHAPLDPILPLAAVLAAPCPVVGTFHASHGPGALWSALYGRLSPLAALAVKKLTASIAVSDEARRSIAYYQPQLALRCIPNGVDCARFAGPLRAARAGAIITFIGRPDPRKGLAHLLRAFERMTRAGLTAELRVIGVDQLPSHDWALLSELARTRVHLLGYVHPDAIAHELRAADILCAPSTHAESQGIVLLEGFAAGVAVVASDIPGYRDVVDHMHNGVLCPPANAEALANALSDLLRDTDKRLRLAAAGLEASKRYDWSAVGAQIEQCLRAAAETRPPLQSALS
jgi:phosphatidylinositol alpha-mannosyltransferase